VINQYSGVEPSDPRFEPYLALAEEWDIPVGIHIETGPPGAPYLGFDDYRARFHSPLGLKEVLLAHQDCVCTPCTPVAHARRHAGRPLCPHPQVHVDIGVIVYTRPRVDFYRYLQAIVDSGFIDRVLFGSDQTSPASSRARGVARPLQPPEHLLASNQPEAQRAGLTGHLLQMDALRSDDQEPAIGDRDDA
jgi:predicted TIM-barrel fold metal-dependent hydrolase